MQIPTLFVIIFAFFTAAFAAPVERRAAAAVFTTQTYNQLSISGGTAGNAQAQASAKFAALNLANAKNVASADLDFLNSVNQIANDAETEAFNPAIAAATGAAKTALQVIIMSDPTHHIESSDAYPREIERQDPEQGPQADRFGVEVAGPSRPGPEHGVPAGY